ncbi:MAG: HAD family hydrolase [Candidatus Gastranaerophilales bacterium]|nr:HAD family hydrolase [Candidatus Gastranaerophilales bacterium]
MFDVKNIVFDMDGTLLDTVDDLLDSVNFALETLGYNKKTKDEVRLAVGSGVTVLFEKMLPNGFNNPDITVCIQKFKEYYSNLKTSKTKPYDGIIPLLSELKKRGIKTGILSNKFDRGCKMHSRLFFGDLIDYAQGEDEFNGIKRKPSPMGLYKLLDEIKGKKENTVFVGDSEVDIQTAKNAGIPCISVLWGLKSKEFLAENGGKIFVSSPLEILDMI